jgi:hypothetical protein
MLLADEVAACGTKPAETHALRQDPILESSGRSQACSAVLVGGD